MGRLDDSQLDRLPSGTSIAWRVAARGNRAPSARASWTHPSVQRPEQRTGVLLSHIVSRRGVFLAISVVLASSGAVACASSKSVPKAAASSKSSLSSPANSAASSPAGSPASSVPAPPPVIAKKVSTTAIGVGVTGKFGAAPTVQITAGAKAPTTSEVAIVSRGKGPLVKAGELLIAHDYGRTWASATAFQNDFTGAPPDTLPIGSGQVSLPGLDSALVGVPIGSRAVVVVPPSQGFAAGVTLPTGVTKTDTLVFVFDIVDTYAPNDSAHGSNVKQADSSLPKVSTATGAKPTITIPKASAPTKLEVSTVIAGSGPAITAGDEVVSQYIGQIWASGKEFDSSWKHKDPSAFVVGANQLIPAWDKSLVGVKTGSRILIIAPPADAYGSAGQSSAGIKGTDTLVFVIDVLGTYPSVEGSAAAASAAASPEPLAPTTPPSPAAS